MKLKLVNQIIDIFAVTSLVAFIGGTGILLGSTVATSVIELGKALQPQEPAYHKLMIVGSGWLCSSILLGGTAIAIAATLREELEIQELQEMQRRLSEMPIKPQTNCASCHYFSGTAWLPCAVHPNGKENCPDWSAKNE